MQTHLNGLHTLSLYQHCNTYHHHHKHIYIPLGTISLKMRIRIFVKWVYSTYSSKSYAFILKQKLKNQFNKTSDFFEHVFAPKIVFEKGIVLGRQLLIPF